MKVAVSTILLALSGGKAVAQTILEIVVASPDHTTLEAAVLAAPASIAEALGNAEASLTLFAPDDTAFFNLIDAVGQEYVNDLLTPPWSAHLTCLLTSHVISSVVPSNAITGPASVATLSGYEVSVDNVDGEVTVDGIPVTVKDIEASNGVIHSITALPILPPCVSTNIYDLGASVADLSTLISLVDMADLKGAVSTTRPLTLFAPTNAAFDKLPLEVVTFLTSDVQALSAVLRYHTVNEIILLSESNISGQSFTTLNGGAVSIGMNGGMFTIEGSTIAAADTLASNGVVHIIDTVLIPPGFVLPTPPPVHDFMDDSSSESRSRSSSSSDSGSHKSRGMGMGKSRKKTRALRNAARRGQ